MRRLAIAVAFLACLLDPAISSAQQPPSGTPGSGTTGSAEAGKAIDPQLKADIEHLLVTMKTVEASESGVRTAFQALRPQLVAILPATANREKIINAYGEKLAALVHTQQFQDGLVAIYAKHFTDDEVKKIDAFYQTPTGQHLVQTLPEVIGEAQSLGHQTAMDSIPRILSELCKEFPELQGQVNFCTAGDSNKQSLQFLPRQGPSRQLTSANIRTRN